VMPGGSFGLGVQPAITVSPARAANIARRRIWRDLTGMTADW